MKSYTLTTGETLKHIKSSKIKCTLKLPGICRLVYIMWKMSQIKVTNRQVKKSCTTKMLTTLQYLGLKYELETIPSTKQHRDKKTYLTEKRAIFGKSLLKYLSSY